MVYMEHIQTSIIDDPNDGSQAFGMELWGSSCETTVAQEQRPIVGFDKLSSLSDGEWADADAYGYG